ncbi:MAG: Rho termination factor N-terminal domain-containing protein, partial [Mycobacterium sp.]
MTDTDLIAAGSGADEPDLPTTATSQVSTPAPADVPASAPQGSGALATMVLPELRALANEVGVKGTSGMRKNELIAAIRERRGEPNDKARNGGSAPTDDAGGSDAPADGDQRARDRRDAKPEARAEDKQDKPQTQQDKAGADKSTGEEAKPDSRRDGDQAQGGDQHGGGQNRGDDDGEGRQGGRRGRRFRDRRR